MRRIVFVLLFAWALVACGASGGSEASDAKAKEPPAQVDETTKATTTVAPTTTEAPTTTAAPATTAAPTTTEAPPATVAPASLMPDVVCMGLQDAQDRIQAEAGVFYSRSVDATGQGRSQIVDANWIVVDQTPAPGTPIGEGDAVLSVVKLDEPNDC